MSGVEEATKLLIEEITVSKLTQKKAFRVEWGVHLEAAIRTHWLNIFRIFSVLNFERGLTWLLFGLAQNLN